MTATDAFWVRQGVVESLHTEAWHRWAEGFTASIRGEDPDTLPSRQAAYRDLDADRLTRALRSTLNLAETYYVSPQMHALVTAAAESWPEDEAVTDEDFPTDQGFMWLPGAGLVTIDIRGQAMHVNAITWDRRGSDVTLTWWADKAHDPPHIRDKAPEFWAKQLPQLTPWHLFAFKVGGVLPTAVQMGTVLPPEISDQMRYTDTAAGLSLFFPKGWTPEQLRPRIAHDPIAAWLVSALRIMQQPLAAVRRVGLPANVRRQLQKRPHRLKQTAVTIIDYRRREYEGSELTGREYSHRFLRRGHWRRQPYKREDGTWDRRRIWIHPTIVGPEDKPLILRNHVNAFTR